jgi:hypothetical protein
MGIRQVLDQELPIPKFVIPGIKSSDLWFSGFETFFAKAIFVH